LREIGTIGDNRAFSEVLRNVVTANPSEMSLQVDFGKQVSDDPFDTFDFRPTDLVVMIDLAVEVARLDEIKIRNDQPSKPETAEYDSEIRTETARSDDADN